MPRFILERSPYLGASPIGSLYGLRLHMKSDHPDQRDSRVHAKGFSTGLLALFLGLVITASTRAGGLKIVPPPEGMYMGHASLGRGEAKDLERLLGAKVPLWWPGGVDGVEGGAPLDFSAEFARLGWNRGYPMLVGALEASPAHRGFTVDKLLGGHYDAELHRLAEKFKEFGKPMFFETAREINLVLGRYMGGFGLRGDQPIDWAIANNSSHNSFDASRFTVPGNSGLLDGLGSSDVCDGLERAVAAQRYYYDFFTRREGIDFLTFGTMGWGISAETPKDRLRESCTRNFAEFYRGIKDYSDWITVTWYMFDDSDQGRTSAKKYLSALDGFMDGLRRQGNEKPIMIMELGFCGPNQDTKIVRMQAGLKSIIHKYPEIKAIVLWGEEENFPCGVTRGASGLALRDIVAASREKFEACVHLSNGETLPDCRSMRRGESD